MKIFFGLLTFCALSLPAFATDQNEIAYRYTDENDADEDDEYFDAYGNKITETEYRYAHEQQSKQMQEAASKPFGSAGTEFGGLRKKKEETKPAEVKKEEAPAPAEDEVEAEEEEENKKPRVLVS